MLLTTFSPVCQGAILSISLALYMYKGLGRISPFITFLSPREPYQDYHHCVTNTISRASSRGTSKGTTQEVGQARCILVGNLTLGHHMYYSILRYMDQVIVLNQLSCIVRFDQAQSPNSIHLQNIQDIPRLYPARLQMEANPCYFILRTDRFISLRPIRQVELLVLLSNQHHKHNPTQAVTFDNQPLIPALPRL